jgi:hypothetical protein
MTPVGHRAAYAFALGRALTSANQRVRFWQLSGTGTFAHLPNSTTICVVMSASD